MKTALAGVCQDGGVVEDHLAGFVEIRSPPPLAIGGSTYAKKERKTLSFLPREMYLC